MSSTCHQLKLELRLSCLQEAILSNTSELNVQVRAMNPDAPVRFTRLPFATETIRPKDTITPHASPVRPVFPFTSVGISQFEF